MKVVIIGAGAAGLSALKHSLDEGHQCVVFEQTGKVGGTWNYTDNIGIDENGLPVHSSMYQGLRTNLPKELMQYEGFPYEGPEYSYLSHEEVLKYINKYTKSLNLSQHIKFYKHVTEINPLPQEKWSVKVKDMKTNVIETDEYDAIFVCVGNYSVPYSPHIDGIEKFKGRVIHSHIYRKSDPYRNRKVLVIGAGPSGIDISKIVAEVADKVFICIRSSTFNKISEKVTVKPEIEKFEENSVRFNNGSEEVIDDVIFCTGYTHTFPFLSADCEIKVENNWVKYIYKHVINVKHPTMAFIGIPLRITPFPVFGIQVRFFLAYLKGKFNVTKEHMLQEVTEYLSIKQEPGGPRRRPHELGLKQGEYMNDLADTANIKRVPPVLQKLYEYVHSTGKGKYLDYRLISEEEFNVKS